MDVATTTLGLALVIAAVIELGRRIKLQDWFAVGTILASAALGLLFGVLHWYGLTPESGLTAALQASGLITVASKVG